MRPRLIAVDDGIKLIKQYKARSASMRPRLIAVDDTAGEVVVTALAVLQ